MSQFTLAIDTSNAAFEDPGEVPRILRYVADRIEERGSPDADSGNIRDVNGNRVGEWLTLEEGLTG